MKTAIKREQLTYSLAKWGPFFHEGTALFELHREEVARDKDLMQLAVNEEYYQRAQNIGNVSIVVARAEGRLVGYVVWLLYRHPHYSNVFCAQEDVHYLLPEYRRGMNGYLLLKNAIEFLRPLGVKYCIMREKIGHEHPALMTRLGFSPLDVVYSRRLDREG